MDFVNASMSLADLQSELAALKVRAQEDKKAMSQLKDQNESLLQKLQSGGAEGLVGMPQDQGKCAVFSGGSSAMLYDWVDEINASVGYGSYSGFERAANIYEYLGGEAKQEIKHRPLAEKSNPEQVLEIL